MPIELVEDEEIVAVLSRPPPLPDDTVPDPPPLLQALVLAPLTAPPLVAILPLFLLDPRSSCSELMRKPLSPIPFARLRLRMRSYDGPSAVESLHVDDDDDGDVDVRPSFLYLSHA